MRRIIITIAMLTTLLLAGNSPATAQQQEFDIDVYRQFLATHANLQGSDLLMEHPAPLLRKHVDLPVGQAEWLDSISTKYQLTKDELELIGENGFMVTERIAPYTFEQGFIDIWTKDLPVFISADAMLHTLHLSYDRILMDLEQGRFLGLLRSAADSMFVHQTALEAKYGAIENMRSSLRDVDLYLTVLRSLIGWYEQPFYEDNRDEVNTILDHIATEEVANIHLFSSSPRSYDFSQFTLRGHYANNQWLAQYFRAMMWLGRTEFMLTKPVQQGAPEQTDEDIQRQVIDAALLVELMERSGADENFHKLDALLVSLIGESDNVSPWQLREVLTEARVISAASLLDMEKVTAFQRLLTTKSFAMQRINSQILMSDPMDPRMSSPPAAFLLCGQRFVLDAYILGNVVFDRIMYEGRKVMRMQPSAMDVLFGLGNNAAAQFLQDDMNQFPYASNLNALRFLIDGYDTDFWKSSSYNSWLAAIRSLNIPADVTALPPFMQTAAWWQQKMNTQLASWAQLRHDNLLYAKSSYGMSYGCSFPRAYVEPLPGLWQALSEYATNIATKLEADSVKYPLGYLHNFASIMDTLGRISEKELSGDKLTPEEHAFASGMLYRVPDCVPRYSGWYSSLIYGYQQGEPFDAITVDVHTAPSDESGNSFGGVMHAGTGRPNMGVFVASDANGVNTAYVGPVFSYYEHTTTNFQRLNDEEWKERILNHPPQRPSWTNNYLADTLGRRNPIGPSLLTEIAAIPGPAPTTLMLDPVYPNPVGADGTLLRFSIDRGAHASLSIHDINGHRLATLFDQYVSAGNYFLRWDGTSADGRLLPTGMYLITLVSEENTQTQRVIITR